MLREDSPTSSYRLFLLLERARPDLTQDDRYDKFNKKAVASSGKGEPFQRASGTCLRTRITFLQSSMSANSPKIKRLRRMEGERVSAESHRKWCL